jgi:DNA polymerase-3 subunit alpha
MKNNFVYVRTFIKDGWTNRETKVKGDPRIQYNNFQLLHDVMDTYAKKLSIQLNISDLDKDKITSLKDLIKMHPGKQLLNFAIYDNEENMKLQMQSRKQKVKISQELLNELENSQVFYKLN